MAYLTTYGKIVEGDVSYAPLSVTVDGTYYNPPTASWLSAHGYKPVTDKPEPTTPADEGRHWTYMWMEDASTVFKEWYQEDDELSLDEKIKRFLEGNLIEMITVDDNGREVKSYVLKFPSASPDIDTGDEDLDKIIKASLKKAAWTDNEGKETTVYTPIFTEAQLKSWGVVV